MHPSRWYCLWASLATLLCVLAPSRASAETFTITSTPPGATVEIDGVVVGTTPYHTEYPGGYFHKPHTVFGARLDHAMVLRLTKNGYGPQQLNLTEGPLEWIAVTGRREGNYFLLKSRHFEIHLEPGPAATHSNGEDSVRSGPVRASETGVSGHPPNATNDGATGTVNIDSEPGGAEIYVDGRLAGQTPSLLRLPGGSHQIEVKTDGRQSWLRDLDLSVGSEITLHATLTTVPKDAADTTLTSAKSP